MATGIAKLAFNDRPWFVDAMEADLRAQQKAGAHFAIRRDDSEWVREAPDGSQTLLGYRDEDYIRRKREAEQLTGRGRIGPHRARASAAPSDCLSLSAKIGLNAGHQSS